MHDRRIVFGGFGSQVFLGPHVVQCQRIRFVGALEPQCQLVLLTVDGDDRGLAEFEDEGAGAGPQFGVRKTGAHSRFVPHRLHLTDEIHPQAFGRSLLE